MRCVGREERGDKEKRWEERKKADTYVKYIFSMAKGHDN
jgi:hypothetical protein